MKKVILLFVANILLISCSTAPQHENTSRPISDPEKDKAFTAAILGVEIDPNEKNPLMYELPGMWELANAGDDCKKVWQEVRISYDKTTLSLTRVMKKNDTNTPIEKTYFSILEAGENYLKLQTKYNQKPIDEYWTLVRKIPFAFAMRNNKTHEITPTYLRCTSIGISFEGKITEADFENLAN